MKLNKSEIINLLPHREPMLLIDELREIKKLHSATAIMNVKKDSFYVDGHFPGNPVMPGVLIIESFAQVASCMFAKSMPDETKGKLFFLTTVDKAKFRNPVQPGDLLYLKIEKISGKGPLQKFSGIAEVDGKKMAQAELSAMVVSKKA